MSRGKIVSETELCARFLEAHPGNDHIYRELHMPTGRADMIHRQNKIITIYEAKVSLSLEVLYQCINRKDYAHFVYAVVPQARSRRQEIYERLFTDYGIGLIVVQETTSVYEGRKHWHVPYLGEVVRPKFNRHPKGGIHFREENKHIPAGTQAGGITPFKAMVLKLTENLKRRGRLTLEQAFKEQSYYSTPTQFKTNIYKWCRKGVIDSFYLEKGFIYPTETNPEAEWQAPVTPKPNTIFP